MVATPLDTLFAGVPIAFVKCDVEGHELECLDGAVDTLRRSRPPWLIEVWGDPDEKGSAAHDVFRRLEELGYQPHCFDGEKLERRAPGRITDNYWFLTAERGRAVARDRPSSR